MNSSVNIQRREAIGIGGSLLFGTALASASRASELPFAEYLTYDGLGLAELVKRKEVKPEELLESAIARAEAVNPRVNAIVVKLYDQARRYIAKGLPNGPFRGVPMLIKDLGFWMKGVECTDGSQLYKGNVPTSDDTVIERLQSAGLVIFGRTHVPEFGLVCTSESRLHGITRNPWNLNKVAGGSSGGTAAAVASGIAPFGTASDGGGSIRIPASCCGLFGLKPTRSRVPLGPHVFEMWEGLEVAHAITRSVRDSAALLDAVAGPAMGDSYWAPNHQRPYLDEVSILPGKLRIAVVRKFHNGDSVHPECINALESAQRLCISLHHEVVDRTDDFAKVMPIVSLRDAFGKVWYATAQVVAQSRLDKLGRNLRIDDVEPITRWAIDQGRALSALDLSQARSVIHVGARKMAEFQKDYDVILCPTLAGPPIDIGLISLSRQDREAMIRDIVAFAPFTQLANQTGQPAMSVPLYWTPDGLPIGVQFYGRFGDEGTLFRLAAQLEEAAPWKDKRPPQVS
jgi:amidase